jgi:hypothetical protein
MIVSRQTLLDLVFRISPVRTEELLSPLLDLLTSARRSFDGDLDKYVILLVVTIRAANHPQFVKNIEIARAQGKAAPSFPSLGVNIQSIADSIGAPKETIRRKVADMVEEGWIERRGNHLYLTAAAYQEHKFVRELMHLLFVRHYEVVRDMLAAEGDRPD